MRVDDFEEQREPSAPIDMLETYFQAHGWIIDRVAEDEIIATVQGSWTQYELRGVWRPEDRVLQFLALPMLPNQRRQRMCRPPGNSLVNRNSRRLVVK